MESGLKTREKMGARHGPMASILPSPRLLMIRKASKEVLSASLTRLIFTNALIRLNWLLLSEDHCKMPAKDHGPLPFSLDLGMDKNAEHPIKAGKIMNAMNIKSMPLHLFVKGIINLEGLIFH